MPSDRSTRAQTTFAFVTESEATRDASEPQRGQSAPSVIRIRIQGLKGDGVARVIQQVVQAVESDLLASAAVSVAERRLALRRLPLIPANDVDQLRKDERLA